MRDEQKAQGWRSVDSNVGGRERLLSLFLGGGLIAYALTRRRAAAKLLVVPGALLLARGRSGRSLLYTLFDVSTAQSLLPRGWQARQAAGETRARSQGTPEVPAGQEGWQPTEDSPHPRVPGTHEHPVPPTELGAPSVQVTEKLMSEISSSVGTEPEAGR